MDKEKTQNNNDVITNILELWSQFTVLLSDACNTAAITKLNDEYSFNDVNKQFTLWPNIVKYTEAFERKLEYLIKNDLPNITKGKYDRLFGLSDGRKQAIMGLRNLLTDLKTTDNNSTRYNNLNISIVSLFNSLNLLLKEVNRILTNVCNKNETYKHDLSIILKRDIGL